MQWFDFTFMQVKTVPICWHMSMEQVGRLAVSPKESASSSNYNEAVAFGEIERTNECETQKRSSIQMCQLCQPYRQGHAKSDAETTRVN